MFFKKIWPALILLAFFLITCVAPCEAQDFRGTSLSSTTLPYVSPPFTYKDNRMLYASFRTTAEILKRLVPEPLVPNPDNVMTLYVGKLNIIDPIALNYHEAAIVVPVSYENIAGNYFVTLYLDTCLGIVGGREIYGFSKFDAEINLMEENGKIHASVERYGTTLISVTMVIKRQSGSSPLALEFPIFNLKLVPSVEKNAPFDVMQLTSTELQNHLVQERQSGKATLVFRSSPTDPLGEIPILGIISGSYQKESFILDYGKVLHNYLSKNSKGKVSLQR